MSIHHVLEEHLHKAIKEKDEARKTTLRLLMSSLKLAEVAKGATLSEADELAIIQKEIKTRNDTVIDASKVGRYDLIREAENEVKILEEYLPKQVTSEQLLAIAEQVIQEVDAKSMKDMGKVIKVLIDRLAGKASNQDASKAVRELLQENNS
jgi:uncharacterized protein YqeY